MPIVSRYPGKKVINGWSKVDNDICLLFLVLVILPLPISRPSKNANGSDLPLKFVMDFKGNAPK
jgi:hypothetical protein